MAQHNLCLMYAKGEDYVQAYAWTSIARAQGHKGAEKLISLIEDIIIPALIAETQKLSSELWGKYVVPFQKD